MVTSTLKPINSLYIIGSLRNPLILETHRAIREAFPEMDIFSDWFAAGEHADDAWRDYEKALGHDYVTALSNWAARNTFEFDKRHLDRCDASLLVYPAGRSGHLELGYHIGSGKRGFILLDEDPDRFDVMVLFAEKVFRNIGEFITHIWESKHG